MTPVALWRTLCLPPAFSFQGERARYVDTFIFFTFLSLLVGIYSLLKWSSYDQADLIWTSCLLIGCQLVAGLVLRFSRYPELALNIGLMGMVVHALNLVYQSGGVIVSSQVFWMPLMVVAFFLTARLVMASLWSLAIVIACGWMISQHFAGNLFPQMDLSASALQTEVWAGFMLPLVMICVAQAYTVKQRQQAIDAAEQARQTSQDTAQQAKEGEQQLGRILALASDNASQLAEVATGLEQQSTSLHQQVNHLNLNCDSQASAAEQMSQQVRQLTTGIDESDRFVSELKGRSDTIQRQAEKSSESLCASTEAINQILSSNAKIMSVADVISSVADQTNLLALNAAIEAARAGEHGRGFAVVADQVRELSAKSNSSAVDIRALLENSRREVEHGQQVIESSTSELSGIIEQVSRISSDVTQLADTINHQVEALRELNTASAAVASSVVETNQVSDSVASQGALLAEQVERLKGLAGSLNEVVRQR